MKTVPCKGCGKPIVFAKLKDGSYVPLDPKPPVYAVGDLEGIGGHGVVASRVPDTLMVTHFATCPEANRFSKGRKKS